MKTFILIMSLSWVPFSAFGQDQIDAYMKEAQGYLSQKDYRQAQLSLQDVINEINNILAQQVAEALPVEMNGLKATGSPSIDGSAMAMMGSGIQITQVYQHPSKEENQAEIIIMSNSPMLSAINMFMANPGMMGDGYKSVRVGTKRAIMKTEMEDYYGNSNGSKSIRSSEIQIPLSQTLITINARGFATEQEELAFAVKLDIDKLKTLLGE